MRLTRWQISTVFLLCVFGLLPTVTLAATVTIRVVDESDQPVASTTVGLRRIEETTRRSFFRMRQESDPAGRAFFSSIEPGRYAVHVFTERGQFVLLRNHPAIEQHSITIAGDNEQHVSTVRVVRGTPVVFRVSVEGQYLPGARVLLHDLDREYRTEIEMNERLEREVRLVAGRWTARVDPVPGYLLTGVEVNRTVFPNDVAEFDLPVGTQAWYVNFEFAGQAHIGGRVTFERESFGMSVVANLVEGGPWLAAAQTRGGSKYDRVSARPIYPTYEYEMVVPSGFWTVRPEATGLESADPPEVQVQLEAGDYEIIDFVVDGTHRGGGKWARIRVEDPDGRRVREARVEVWPTDPDVREEQPIAEAETGWGDANVYGLAEGELLFVAGKPGFVEAAETLEPPHPTKGRVRLRLGRGATIHAVAVDEDDEPAPDVDVVLARDDDFVSLLANREVAGWAAHPTGKTDGSGHLWLRGVYPGRYVLSGTFENRDETMFFAEFRNKGDTTWIREMEKEYRGTETDEIEIRLAPAGVLRATLHCSDGTELPPEADLLVLDGLRTYEPETWWDEGVLKIRSFVLEGQRRDSFHIGPLDPGAYSLLVRPDGHNRWTWAIGTETADEATVLTVAAGDPTDLGAIAIDCNPAIAVRPIPPEGVRLPDLVATGIYDPIAELTGVLKIDDGERALGHGRLVAEPPRVQFRDLPEGQIRSTVTVWNPLFLPDPALSVAINATLERGRTVETSAAVEGIGGAIEIDLSQVQEPEHPVRAIRVEPIRESDSEPVEPWLVGVDGTSVIVPSLPEGSYDFDLCFDVECSSRVPLWRDVPITAGLILTPQSTP